MCEQGDRPGLVAVGNDEGMVLTSVDGITWTAVGIHGGDAAVWVAATED